jgi:carboxyl-terminal processing protease
MKARQQSYIGYIALGLLGISALSLNAEPPKETAANFDEVTYNWSRTFAEVVQATQQKHYKVQDAEQCMIKAIDGFLTSLDPHSGFLDPKTYKNILQTTSGEFFGIGIIIDNTRQNKEKFSLITGTIPDGPADNAGVEPLDKIVEIDGKPLEGMSTEDATAMLKGERNTTVHVKIIREKYPDLISLDITRDEIKEQSSLCYHLPDQNIYYLSLTMFSDSAVQQIQKLLKQLKNKEYKGLILDLRNNSGGLLNAAIDIAGMFVNKGSLVVLTKSKGNKEIERYATRHAPLMNNAAPIFILINNYTASAAEILAGCLKIHSESLAQQTSGKKAQKNLMVFLVGSRSFGKGSVQEVIPVSNNCAMKITTSLYYLPNDTSIQGVGIEPDLVLEKRFPPTEQMIWFNKNYGREGAFANYIKADTKQSEDDKKDKEKPKKDKSWSERTKDALNKDSQLRETISLINMLSTAQHCCPDQVSNRTKAVKFLKDIYLTDTENLKLNELKI